MKIEPVDSRPAGPPVCDRELAVLGEIALLIDPTRLFETLEPVLERLRHRLRADACELFLSDGPGREVFLVAHAGADADAFTQRLRFASGEGVPGIVLRTGSVLSIDSLEAEAEFLRTRVKARGYRSLLAAPLKREGGPAFGCLLLAWKRVPDDLADLTRLALLAAHAIGGVVWVARVQARLEGSQSLHRAPDLGERLRAMTGADSAAVIFEAGVDRGSASHATASPPVEGRLRVGEPGVLDRCPARTGACAQLLGGREGWPRPCLEAGCAAKARYCVPLMAGGRVLGVATGAFHARVPVPLSRTLPAASWLTEDLALTDDGREPRGHADAAGEPRPRLEIRCLGPFRVTFDGRPIGRAELGREKARELLSLLVVAQGRPVPWHQLAEQLWPDRGAATARNRFHVTLAALRATLEPREGRGWTYLRRDGQRYLLDPDASLLVDAWRFQELLRRARSSPGPPPEIGTRLSLLEEAASLYEGDAFGGEFAGTWHDEFARRSREAVLEAFCRIAELRLDRADPPGALAALRRAESIAPLREDVQRLLMRALEADGRRGEALACYERLRIAVDTAFGVAPSAETRLVYERLLARC
jgi:DNA-binding SARP family transcriptional activator